MAGVGHHLGAAGAAIRQIGGRGAERRKTRRTSCARTETDEGSLGTLALTHYLETCAEARAMAP